MLQRLSLSLALLCAVLLGGCSKKEALDRETAGKIIANTSEFNTPADFLAKVGKYGPACLGGYPPTEHTDVIVLQKVGYATVAPAGKDLWQVDLTQKGKEALAAEKEEPFGHSVENGCDTQLIRIRLGERKFDHVSGIVGDANTAVVEFWWKWKPTEIGSGLMFEGSLLQQLNTSQWDDLTKLPLGSSEFEQQLQVRIPLLESEKGKVGFKKYDDGWRIVK
jgi:hypothetical protein